MRRLEVCLQVGVLGCPSDDPPSAGTDTTGGSESTSSAASTGGSTDGADDTTTGEAPPIECGDDVPSFVDPLRLVGSSEPGLTGLVSLAATATHVFGCSHDAGLTVWSMADPTAPAVVATGLHADAAASPRCDQVALAVDDTTRLRLITARRPVDGEAGVTVWDVTDPAAPAALAHWSTPLPVEAAVLDGVRVVVAAGPEGLRTLALDLDQLVEQGSFVDAQSDARALALDGDLLLVAEARAGLRSYDVAPDDPVLQGAAGLGAVALDVELHDARAYVATLEAVAVVDVTDATQPQLMAQVPTPGAALDLARRDDLLVLADWDEVRGISVADPRAPRLRLGEPAPGSGPLDRARAVATSGSHVVVSGWRGLHAYALEAEPSAPELEVETLRVDFRTDAPGQTDDHVVVLRNTGNAPLTVCGIESTLPGVSIDVTAGVIEAGSTLPVEIALTAQGQEPQQGQLRIHSSDPDEPLWAVPLTANTPRLDVGDAAIGFHYVDTEGRAWSSERLAGQVWLLAYFASWCPTCNAEFPGYQTELYQVYAAEGLAVLGLGNEPVGKILAFQGTVGASFPLLVSERSYRDWEDPPGGSYSLQVVVGRDGVVRAIGNELTAADLEPLIARLLAE
ncbi:MAG: redoxin domain-containing protein [Myxococcales bacterium]|nr:redoxin domain-containing protein [Myxococcales bacterium]